MSELVGVCLLFLPKADKLFFLYLDDKLQEVLLQTKTNLLTSLKDFGVGQ